MVAKTQRGGQVILVSHKRCRKCLVTKRASDFYANNQQSDGLGPYCRSCLALYQKVRYQRDKEKIRAKTRAWYDANQGKVRAAWNARYSRNRAEIIKYVGEWQKKNKGRKAEYQRRHALKHPHVRALRDRRRKVALKRSIMRWSDMVAINALYQKAREMSVETGIEWQVDHIVPIKSKLVCGLHVLTNLRLATKSENSSKGNRHWPDMPM